MKTLRIHLPVLATTVPAGATWRGRASSGSAVDDVPDLLDLVTRVPGVVAALVDAKNAHLTVTLHTSAVALLVRHQVEDALLLGHAAVKA